MATTNYWRFAGNLNVPLTQTIAARVDGVYVKRDGFYYDPTNKTDVNDRDRYFVRGSILFEPSSDLSVRLIADYTRRNEKCCGATYVGRTVNPSVGTLNEPLTPVTRVSVRPRTATTSSTSSTTWVSR